MQKWEEIEQKKEYLEGYINSKNREALIKDQIQQLRLDTMFPVARRWDTTGQQSKGSIRLHGKDRKPHGGVKKRMG